MGLSEHDQRLLALIDWYREMGADEALGEAPVDWFGLDARAPGSGVIARIGAMAGGVIAGGTGQVEVRSKPVPDPRSGGSSVARGQAKGSGNRVGEPVRSFQTPPPDASLASAREAVAGAKTLSELQEKLLAFDGCGLKATAKNTCFYRGSAQARVMIIGEAPGRDEDREGRPFVGRAGQLLDRMIGAIDLGEDDVHITNVVYWRPPGNRTPTEQEARVCRPFLEQQVRLVAPEIVILLGGAAAKNLLDTPQGIMRLRGKWRDLDLGGANRKVLATLHPAYLLRTPAAKRLAWHDLLALKGALAG